MSSRYKRLKLRGRSKLLHRHVVEQHLGRSLRRDEHVHHRNGDRYDNRIDNLCYRRQIGRCLVPDCERCKEAKRR
jgi:hypothetical protein